MQNLLKYLSLIFLLLPWAGYCQQDSKITLDSSNSNNVNVLQSGTDSLQNAEIQINKSDSNDAKVSQVQKDIEKEKSVPSSFNSFITSTRGVVLLLISIITFFLLVRKLKKKRTS